MPKDNIERAIQKGIGGGEREPPTRRWSTRATGPGGVAILLEALTDNRNRTVGEVRHVLVAARRQPRRQRLRVLPLREEGPDLRSSARASTLDALLEAALEAGAEDVVEGARRRSRS